MTSHDPAVSQRDIEAPIAAAWALISNFGGLTRWSDAEFRLTLTGSGVGAVRLIEMSDRTIHETLVELDAVAHQLAYQIRIPPSPDLLSTTRLELASLGPARTRARWSVTPTKPWTEDERMVAAARSAGRLADLERYARDPKRGG